MYLLEAPSAVDTSGEGDEGDAQWVSNASTWRIDGKQIVFSFEETTNRRDEHGDLKILKSTHSSATFELRNSKLELVEGQIPSWGFLRASAYSDAMPRWSWLVRVDLSNPGRNRASTIGSAKV
jgi:hypothetical protein